MAKLEEITKSLNINLDKNKPFEKSIGHKRRPWLIEKETDNQNNLPQKLNKVGYELNNKIEKNLRQIGLENEKKLEPNWSQTRAKLESEPEPNRSQTGAKLEPEKIETRAGTGAKTGAKLEPNWSQMVQKKITPINFSSMVGLQREITLILFNECKKSRSKITVPLSLEYLVSICKGTNSSVKKALQRLEKKQILVRVEWKDGRGGWTRYELKDSAYNEILQNGLNEKLEPNWSQTRAKLEPELGTELEPNPPSSSSIYINTTTTELPEDWQKIDISGLESVGFSTHHLLQLYRTGITDIGMIQDSIHHFAYDLSHNQKGKEIKTNAIAYFMGTMKRVGVYTPPDNYESEQTRGMRIYLEQKKKQQEKQLAMENELIELSYNDWVKELSAEEKRSLIPETIANGKLEGAKLAALRSHFKKNIWPARSTIIFPQLEEV